jgi:hypothetical protein
MWHPLPQCVSRRLRSVCVIGFPTAMLRFLTLFLRTHHYRRQYKYGIFSYQSISVYEVAGTVRSAAACDLSAFSVIVCAALYSDLAILRAANL